MMKVARSTNFTLICKHQELCTKAYVHREKVIHITPCKSILPIKHDEWNGYADICEWGLLSHIGIKLKSTFGRFVCEPPIQGKQLYLL